MLLTLARSGLTPAGVISCSFWRLLGQTAHLAPKATPEFSCLWAFAHIIPSAVNAPPLETDSDPLVLQV